MLSMLNKLKNELCPICSVGDPIKILQYKASGNCMDYVFEKLKVPYSIAWEIFTNDKQFKQMDEFINSERNKNYKNPDKITEIYNNKFNSLKNSFMESSTKVNLKSNNQRRLMKNRTFTESENKMCFKMFNPANKEVYDYTINLWNNVIFN